MVSCLDPVLVFGWLRFVRSLGEQTHATESGVLFVPDLESGLGLGVGHFDYPVALDRCGLWHFTIDVSIKFNLRVKTYWMCGGFGLDSFSSVTSSADISVR
jgi:hypothetical protein